MSDENTNPHGLEIRRPTPEQLEGLKKAAAFAYGRSLAMLGATGQQKYVEQVHRLQAELHAFGCLTPDGRSLIQPYFQFQLDGAFHAVEELEKLGL